MIRQHSGLFVVGGWVCAFHVFPGARLVVVRYDPHIHVAWSGIVAYDLNFMVSSSVVHFGDSLVVLSLFFQVLFVTCLGKRSLVSGVLSFKTRG